jgi:hypothetical protein
MPTVYGHEDRSKRVLIGQRVYDIPILYLDQEGIDRLRLGYLCIACMQPHEVPFPTRCAHPQCMFPIERYQVEVFEHLYVGPIRIGPQTTLEEEQERMKEEYARMKRERDGRSSIWLPGDRG